MITTKLDGGVAVITIARQEKRNALDLEHLELLESAVAACLGTGTRAVVITGSGSSFCAGADLDSVYSHTFRTTLYSMLSLLTAAPVPVIAAVNGPAIGAGTQLAIACDLRVAAPEAVFAVPTARNGLAVDPWTIRRLALLAGGGTARALLLACETFDAERALGRGLADRLGTIGDAVDLAHEIAICAPLSLTYSKRVLGELELDDWSDALHEEFGKCWNSSDFDEARRARADGRKPRFTGK
ncbi:enoyl-CoA hydratase [Nocardia pseudovaccinii]|uniref:enoyl-CoA hydratase n=1 Tax=Nocardia pseudovaccinii TaxID=189540 RepID=UPI0007A3990E|nr:enoyl-CoA hydratase [Nocardia pseudovaccinii]